jgi:hypothetical protein
VQPFGVDMATSVAIAAWGGGYATFNERPGDYTCGQ